MGDGKLGRQRKNDSEEKKDKILSIVIPEDGSKMTYSPRGRAVPFLVVFTTIFIFLTYWVNSRPNFDHIPRQESWNAAGGFNGFYPVRRLSKNNDNIFFIETSCTAKANVHNNLSKGLHLNSRQACAIYSAAKKNPTRPVVLFHSCLLHKDYYEKSSDVIKAILDLPNVAIVNMDVLDIYLGSILEPLLISGKLSRSQYPVEHNADILRILLIYLFGGTYMDMDVISLKPLDGLGHNYIGAQEETQLGSGVFHFDYDGVGHEYLKLILLEVIKTYDPYSWAGNGPVLAGKILQSYCNMSMYIDWRLVGLIPGCNITVHPPKTFYPIDFHNWIFYYNETKLDLVTEELKDTYVVHVWNHLSHEAAIQVGSKQPYGVLARDHCSPVYWKSKPVF